MRVLLVNPPARRFARCQHPSFPLGLGYVASALVADGHDVGIYDAEWGPDFGEAMQPVEHPLLDMCLNWHRYFEALDQPRHAIWGEVERVISERAPEVIGVTCRVLDSPAALIVGRIAKSVNPGMTVVLGGPATTTCTDMIVRDPHVDFAVRGEGEITTVELLRVLGRSGWDAGAVPGVSFRGPLGPVHTSDRPLLGNVNELPYPARDRLLYTGHLPGRKVAHMMGEMVTSRGCPYRCTFCAVHSVWGSPKVRLRAPDDVVAEVIQQRDRYGSRFFTFWDDLFTTNRKRTAAICRRLLDARADVRWVCLVRANNLDEELLALMKEAGCVQVQMGVESGSERILERLKKGITLADVRRAADLVHRAGISLHAFLLMGIPTETRQEMEASMRLIQELDPDCVELSVFSPYPGSPLFDELMQAGRLTEDDWLRADFLNVGRCHTGTMTDAQFRELLLDYLQQCDEHNNAKQRHLRARLGSAPTPPEPVAAGCP